MTESKFLSSDTEILPLIAAGMVNKQIAAELGIKEKSVKNRLSRMYARLQVSNRAEAVRAWMEQAVRR